MLKQLGFIVLILQKGRVQAARLGDLSFTTERVSSLAPLTGAKDPTFSKIKDLIGSQLKEGLPLDHPGFRKGGFRLQAALGCLSLHLSHESQFSRSHPCFMSFRQIRLSPNNSWIKSAGLCSPSAKHLLFLLQEDWSVLSSINCVTT